MMRKSHNIALVVLLCIAHIATATLGVDMSAGLCSDIGLSQWQCLRNNGYEFAIIQAWAGGYGYGKDTARCVSQAYEAGFKHVDVYIFMCNNCNSNAADTVESLVNTLRSQKVNFGMLWFDVEQCSGCWQGAGANCDFIAAGVNKAKDMGVHIGLYSSEYEWGQTVGSCNAFRDDPLWYAHYDGQANFDDSWAYEFGGWTHPAMKQFNDQGPCYTVDVNWYPDGWRESLNLTLSN